MNEWSHVEIHGGNNVRINGGGFEGSEGAALKFIGPTGTARVSETVFRDNKGGDIDAPNIRRLEIDGCDFREPTSKLQQEPSVSAPPEERRKYFGGYDIVDGKLVI